MNVETMEFTKGKLPRIHTLLWAVFHDVSEFPAAYSLHYALNHIEGVMLANGEQLLANDVVVVALASTQGPSEMAEALLESLGVDHCAALGRLLLDFVQAERMRGQATIQEVE